MSPVTAPQRSAAARMPLATPSVAPLRRPADHRPDLAVVRHQDRRRRIGPVAGIGATVLLFVALLGLAGAHTLLVQGQIRLDGLEADLAAERARYQTLRLEAAGLESPGRIVDVAQERLGMVSPAELVYLTPPVPSTVGVPGDRAPDTGPEGGAPLPATGDQAWSTVKPLLDSVAP